MMNLGCQENVKIYISLKTPKLVEQIVYLHQIHDLVNH